MQISTPLRYRYTITIKFFIELTSLQSKQKILHANKSVAARPSYFIRRQF